MYILYFILFSLPGCFYLLLLGVRGRSAHKDGKEEEWQSQLQDWTCKIDGAFIVWFDYLFDYFIFSTNAPGQCTHHNNCLNVPGWLKNQILTFLYLQIWCDGVLRRAYTKGESFNRLVPILTGTLLLNMISSRDQLAIKAQLMRI